MAAQQVFDIYELCEQILLYLDDGNDMIRCFRLTTNVRLTILRSSPCRQRLFITSEPYLGERRTNDHIRDIGIITSAMGRWKVRLRTNGQNQLELTMDLERKGRITEAPVKRPEMNDLLEKMYFSQPKELIKVKWACRTATPGRR
ncbi:hypothetical protein Tdes44962_MAKER07091 [Teratosphaeria destructans]|uniref:Uncharacterized protein n=1 Tax=Teratosphaeria destructans TaxID=418781 RepID=A0A9W7W6L1_9PEZI|nr:hypothetical protein Tdes44962_MAKER07091 [Teratosphaeria destructans]